ncbi:hypothetical protein ACIP2X_06880 [Streptomyces sp. NPDC089424]|uniref:hypothetical protein n=1 Tax=Streptomyces sp. NPDC089424 TaxID=3365917 RepID=UPI0037F36154
MSIHQSAVPYARQAPWRRAHPYAPQRRVVMQRTHVRPALLGLETCSGLVTEWHRCLRIAE